MNIDYRNTEIHGGFLKEYENLVRTVTIETVWNRFVESGRVEAFLFQWKEGMDKKPHHFWDSDIFKWMEAACYILQKENIPELRSRVDAFIDSIEAHQRDDGYFNSYFLVCREKDVFSDREMHELYCAGHMFEAAIAYFEATGSNRFLNIADKYFNLIDRVFRIEKSAPFATPGHEEIELALFRMYKTTNDKKYLRLAVFFLNERGNNSKDNDEKIPTTQRQDNVPLREMNDAVGHSVRLVYLLTAMADCAAETKDEALMAACERVFHDMVTHKMQITAGIGAMNVYECFTVPYDLGTETAYCETCASIGLMYFSNRMAVYKRDAVYADLAERALYNGVASGLSLSGDKFFYENPLSIDCSLRELQYYKTGDKRLPPTRRKKLFTTSCCPPNLCRVFSSLGNYIYSVDGDCCYINQFSECSCNNGEIRISQKTSYPIDGTVRITAKGVKRIYIRVPGWCTKYTLNKHGKLKNGYLEIDNDGGEIVYTMDMEPRLLYANKRIAATGGKVAVARGPIVYCAEETDNEKKPKLLGIGKLENTECVYSPEMRGVLLCFDGFKAVESERLYDTATPEWEKTRIKMIPYYAFANRDECDMCVWLYDVSKR